MFARAYNLTKDAQYLAAGQAALRFLATPFEEGGPMTTMADLDRSLSGFTFFMEYPSKPAVYSLAGHMYAMLGLYDWRVLAQSKEATELLDRALATLINILPYYDMGALSSSDLAHLTIPGIQLNPRLVPGIHVIHIEQLWALYVTGQPAVKEFADKWTGYLQ